MTRRVRGSQNGTTTPPIGGKLCSQTGSWITTGHDVPALLRAARPRASGGGSRKSERTKTKLPVGSARRCSTRYSHASPSVSFGARERGPLARRRSCPATARRAPERLAVGEVEVAAEPARRHRGVEEDVARVRHRLRLREPRKPRGEDAISGRRSATTTTRGASSANLSRTMNSSVAPRRRQPRRGVPVDRVDVVAGPVGPRAGDVGARAAPDARQPAEGEADEPAPRNERDGPIGVGHGLARARRLRSTSSGCGRGARSRQRSRKASSAASHPGARLGEERGPEHDAVHEHGDEEPLDVLGHDVRRPWSSAQARAARSSASAAADRGADRDVFELARRADEVDDPALDHGRDVDVLRRDAELLDLVEVDGLPAGVRAGGRGAARGRSAARRRPPGSRARS